MNSELVIRKTVSNSSDNSRLVRAIENSTSKSVTARKPRNPCVIPCSFA